MSGQEHHREFINTYDEFLISNDRFIRKLRAAIMSAAKYGNELLISKKRLTKSLIEISQCEDIEETIRTERGLYLLKLLNAPDADMQILGCLLLAKQAKFIPEETLKLAIPILIQLIGFNSSSNGVSFHEVSLLALKILARKGENLRTKIGRLGAFEVLLNLASQNDGELKILALQTIRDLVLLTKCNQEMLFQLGGLQTILDLVSSSSDTIKCVTIEILSILSSFRDVRREIAHRSGVSSIIEVMKLGSMDSKVRAAHALGLLAFSKRLRRMIVDAGAIPVLIDLLRDGDETTKLVAGNSLGIISACLDHLWQVAQAGAIPLFIDLLQGENRHGKDIAEDVFCVLAVSEENALLIVDHLIRILHQGNLESKAAAADIIWDLACYRHSVSIMLVSGAIPVLVGLLRHENDELRENVSGAIAQLTYNDEERQVLEETGVIPILVELLQDHSTEVKGNAVEALHNFAGDPMYRSQVLNASALPDVTLFEEDDRIY